MKIAARWISGITVVSLAVLLCMTVGLPVAQGQAVHVSWDIIREAGAPPPGIASAFANDGSHITLTGSGTFLVPAGGDGTSSATTGGGNWEIFNASDVSTGSGTYEVAGLVRWEQKGTFKLPTIVGGVAILRVEFSDGSHGVLTVSCHAPNGGDPAVFEGITVSKSFVDYWNRQAPVAGVDANRTVFHIE